MVQDASVYQQHPLEKHVVISPNYQESIAITLEKLDEVTADIDIKVLRNGMVVGQKTIQLDATTGNFNIAGLNILYERTGAGLKVIKIDEPSNYENWHYRMDSLVGVNR